MNLPTFMSSATATLPSFGSTLSVLPTATGFVSRRFGRSNGLPPTIRWHSWRLGMTSSAAEIDLPKATRVDASDQSLTFALSDGRAVTVPLQWYPRLAEATPAERANWRLIGTGQGVHWPDLDEDISVDSVIK